MGEVCRALLCLLNTARESGTLRDGAVLLSVRLSVAYKGVYSDTTQLNSTELTQVNSVQPISAKQVSRVFVYDVINWPLT